MNANDLIATVQRTYAAFGPGVVPLLVELSWPDVEMDHRYPAGVPMGGIFRGHAGVGQFFRAIGESVELIEFQPMEFVAHRDEVIVFGHEKAKVHRTKKVFVNDWVHRWTFREGKLQHIRSYNDTFAAHQAFSS